MTKRTNISKHLPNVQRFAIESVVVFSENFADFFLPK